MAETLADVKYQVAVANLVLWALGLAKGCVHSFFQLETTRVRSAKRWRHTPHGGLPMLTNLLKYKDYYAQIAFDPSADAFHGRVIGI